MFLSFFGLVCVLGYVAYHLTPDERTRVVRVVVTFLEGDPQKDKFLGTLRERTRWTLITPGLVLLNLMMLMPVLLHPASGNDPDALIKVGGNFAPLTTNGEWWRVVKAMFLHGGMIHFVATTAGLFQIGLVVERFVGPTAFLSVYLASGVLAHLTAIPLNPLGVSVGASGAVFGVYGLLLSTSVGAIATNAALKISLMTLKRVAPAAAIFVLYNLATSHLSFWAELVGLVVGIASGAAFGKEIGQSKPSIRLIASSAAVSMVIASIAAFILRGIDDVRPELGRVVAVEQRTASAYDAAVQRFTKGRLRADELALMIDNVIVPELHAADARLKAFDKVPSEHQPLVASAEEYLRLRNESWRIRAAALRQMGQLVARKSQTTDPQAITLALKQAERTERDSFESLKKITPAKSPQ
jgi:membrane associated rhomboid family serine protease